MCHVGRHDQRLCPRFGLALLARRDAKRSGRIAQVDANRGAQDHGRDRTNGFGEHGLHVVRARERLRELQELASNLRRVSLPFEQARVLDRDGGVGRQDLEEPHVLVVELGDAELRERHRADHVAPVAHGHHDERLVHVRRARDVDGRRILGGVGRIVGLARLGDAPGDAGAERDQQRLEGLALVLRELPAERDRDEHLAILGEQVDAAVVVLDDRVQLGRDRLADLPDVVQLVQALGQAVEHAKLRERPQLIGERRPGGRPAVRLHLSHGNAQLPSRQRYRKGRVFSSAPQAP